MVVHKTRNDDRQKFLLLSPSQPASWYKQFCWPIRYISRSKVIKDLIVKSRILKLILASVGNQLVERNRILHNVIKLMCFLGEPRSCNLDMFKPCNVVLRRMVKHKEQITTSLRHRQL